jgi:hypothetical protein
VRLADGLGGGRARYKSIPLHHWALLVAVLAVVLTCAISLTLIVRHLTNYGDQRTPLPPGCPLWPLAPRARLQP